LCNLPQSRPEELYQKTAAGSTERRQIQAAVIEAHRGHVAALARRMVPTQHRQEAEQVGAIGLLLALEKYDPTPRQGHSTSPVFWSYAFTFARDEIRAWKANGVYWRKPANRGKGEARQANRDAASRHLLPKSMDAEMRLHANESTTLHDVIPSPGSTVEEIVSDVEAMSLLLTFAENLTATEQEILFSENSQRVRSRHHKDLVQRAAAFIKGDTDDERTAVD
jgi:hypothetical protein